VTDATTPARETAREAASLAKAGDRDGAVGFGGIYAAGPCCAAREEAKLRRAGEPVTGRCPEGTPFAGRVRAMRGPDASIRVSRRGAL
jgi:hypothetical protein